MIGQAEFFITPQDTQRTYGACIITQHMHASHVIHFKFVYHAIRKKLRHNCAIWGARSFLLSDEFLSLRGRFYFIKEIKNLFLEHRGGAAWSKDALSDNRDDSRLLMPGGMFFVVIGGWLLSR